jgi:hypothetical protein
MVGMCRIIVWLHFVAAIGAFKYAARRNIVGTALRQLRSSSYVDISLGQFFTLSDFLDMYKGLRDPMNGVFAIENGSGVVQIVDSSSDVYEDIRKYSAQKDLHGVRIQAFRTANVGAMNAYRTELARQTKPVRRTEATGDAPMSVAALRESLRDVVAADEVVEEVRIDSPISPIISPYDSEAGETSAPEARGVREVLELTAANVDKVLNEVRPFLIADGGNVAIVEVDVGKRAIKLALEGACGSCPSSTVSPSVLSCGPIPYVLCPMSYALCPPPIPHSHIHTLEHLRRRQ